MESDFVGLNDPSRSLTAALRQGKTVAEFRAALPIYQHRTQLVKAIENHQVTVVVGGTGSGKTTQLPQYLYELGWSTPEYMVACTQV